MLKKLPLRVLDLETYTRRLQELVAPDISSIASQALYTPYVLGGAGLFHLTTQVCAGYLATLLEELNSNPAREQSAHLQSLDAGGDTLVCALEKDRHRKRNMEVAYLTHCTTECLVVREQHSLRTSASPFGIPVQLERRLVEHHNCSGVSQLPSVHHSRFA
eukprot:gb/GECG01011669.1/.p1 GENE.gb/GECG01011669.1/~~gb/GECG01011669.1/.p1  ORF type:complete len:161 (+),score=4.13 gb/GECG01011669.1/:1-483(+)